MKFCVICSRNITKKVEWLAQKIFNGLSFAWLTLRRCSKYFLRPLIVIERLFSSMLNNTVTLMNHRKNTQLNFHQHFPFTGIQKHAASGVCVCATDNKLNENCLITCSAREPSPRFSSTVFGLPSIQRIQHNQMLHVFHSFGVKAPH